MSVLKEIKPDEYRVAVTPEAVREYVAAGHSVLVETRAGAGIGASDDAYLQAGACVGFFQRAEMILKVKEPQPSEWAQLREHHILFAYLHLAADPEQTHGLIKSRCIAIA